MADLKNDPFFIDTVLQTTAYALKTSDEEKKKIFKNIVLNAADSENHDQTTRAIFLNLIDTFTIWHIKLLILFNDPTSWFASSGKSFPNFLMASLVQVVKIAFPEMADRSSLVEIIWSDLYRNGLTNTSDLRATMTGDGLLQARSTALGKQFLEYISEP